MKKNNFLNPKTSRKFFKFVNARLKNSKTAPFLNNGNGTDIYEDIDKANLFNDYFASVFTTDDGLLPYFNVRSEGSLHHVIFSEEIVFQALKNMKFSLLTLLSK